MSHRLWIDDLDGSAVGSEQFVRKELQSSTQDAHHFFALRSSPWPPRASFFALSTASPRTSLHDFGKWASKYNLCYRLLI
eukprot:7321385-Pyramimonas_sp.AAC.1